MKLKYTDLSFIDIIIRKYNGFLNMFINKNLYGIQSFSFNMHIKRVNENKLWTKVQHGL